MDDKKLNDVLDHLYGEMAPDREDEFLARADDDDALAEELSSARKLLTAYRSAPGYDAPTDAAAKALEAFREIGPKVDDGFTPEEEEEPEAIQPEESDEADDTVAPVLPLNLPEAESAVPTTSDLSVADNKAPIDSPLPIPPAPKQTKTLFVFRPAFKVAALFVAACGICLYAYESHFLNSRSPKNFERMRTTSQSTAMADQLADTSGSGESDTSSGISMDDYAEGKTLPVEIPQAKTPSSSAKGTPPDGPLKDLLAKQPLANKSEEIDIPADKLPAPPTADSPARQEEDSDEAEVVIHFDIDEGKSKAPALVAKGNMPPNNRLKVEEEKLAEKVSVESTQSENTKADTIAPVVAPKVASIADSKKRLRAPAPEERKKASLVAHPQDAQKSQSLSIAEDKPAPAQATKKDHLSKAQGAKTVGATLSLSDGTSESTQLAGASKNSGRGPAGSKIADRRVAPNNTGVRFPGANQNEGAEATVRKESRATQDPASRSNEAPAELNRESMPTKQAPPNTGVRFVGVNKDGQKVESVQNETDKARDLLQETEEEIDALFEEFASDDTKYKQSDDEAIRPETQKKPLTTKSSPIIPAPRVAKINGKQPKDYLAEAQTQLESGKYKEALTSTDSVLDNDPNQSELVEAYRIRGYAQLHLKQYKAMSDSIWLLRSFDPEQAEKLSALYAKALGEVETDTAEASTAPAATKTKDSVEAAKSKVVTEIEAEDDEIEPTVMPTVRPAPSLPAKPTTPPFSTDEYDQ